MILKQKEITDRKTFASYYCTKDAESFSNVFWSDESRFCLSSDASKPFIRRSEEKYHPSWMKTTVKRGNGWIIVWVAFTAAGVRKLIRCEELINAKDYIKIL